MQRALGQVGKASDARRIQAVLLLDEGETLPKISFITAIKRSRLFALRSRYLHRGLVGILRKPRHEKSYLSHRQIRTIKRLLHVHSPVKLGYASSFWTTKILAEHIRLAYGVTYKSRTSYYLIFKRVKFTYHKPGKVFVKRNEAEVQAWKRATRPQLERTWRDPETVILAGDEMILATATTLQKIWLPQGAYPKIEVSNTRKNLSIYGFLNLKTGQEHAFITEKQTMRITRRILGNLRRIYPKKDNRRNKAKGRKLLILWDNPGWHRGSMVTDYIKRDGKIEVIYFPKYSPEENPQEHVWKEGRAKVTHNTFIGDLNQAAKDFVSYLNATCFNYTLLGFTSSPT